MIVKTINTNALRQVASSQLRVCSNRSAQYSEQLLKVDADISAFGLSAQDPLVVIVPDLDEPRPNQQRTAFSVYMQPNHYLQQLKEQCTKIGDLPHEGDFLSLFDWKTEDCGKFIDISTINAIVNFKGYLRREILCVLANFKEVFQREFDTGEVGPEQFILLGSPKVGKSCILALISVFIAVVYQRPVVLHRQAPGFLQTITLLLHAGKYYEWVDPDGRYFDVLSGVVIDRKSIWVCLDGMTQGEIAKKDWASEYKLLATCGEFDVKYDGYDNMKRCLVPYWSHSDLEDFARKCLRMQDSDIAFRLYILGGSFDAFNNDDVARRKVTAAIRSINTSDAADYLLSQYRFGSIEKVDHIRMRGVQDRENVENYMDPTKWTCRVSSKYALCHLSAKLKPDIYERLMDIAKGMKDDRLEDAAFEGYFHSLVRHARPISVQYSKYKNVNGSTATTLKETMPLATGLIECNRPLHVLCEGENRLEYVAMMQRWATNPSAMGLLDPLDEFVRHN